MNGKNTDRDSVTVTQRGVKPSWKRYGNGSRHCTIRVMGLKQDKPASGWMEIEVSETSFGEKRDTTKTASIVVGLEAMRGLRDLLNDLDLGD